MREALLPSRRRQGHPQGLAPMRWHWCELAAHVQPRLPTSVILPRAIGVEL